MADGIALASDVTLPRSATCPTWCADARRAMREGEEGTRELLGTVGRALAALRDAAGADAAAWVWDHPWRTPVELDTSLLTVFIATDAKTTRDQLFAIGASLAADSGGWVASGVRARPGDAVPLLALVRGALVHTWQATSGDGAEFIALRRREKRVERLPVLLRDAHPALFLDGVGHAIARGTRTQPRGGAEIDRLKTAFALRIARRIVAADGIVVPQEVEFLARTFPPALVEAHGLATDLALEEAANKAEATLHARLGYHEKLALLNTFYASCAADGRIEIAEVKVLREAAATLGLSHEEVVAYLARVW